eukprot:GILI01007809.1.p1 GENE.GILI01007809.1~~GILI01007809.1.p1  ORF type:complete len:123 (-),score=4.97 GILI01007809.1:205-573(-)
MGCGASKTPSVIENNLGPAPSAQRLGKSQPDRKVVTASTQHSEGKPVRPITPKKDPNLTDEEREKRRLERLEAVETRMKKEDSRGGVTEKHLKKMRESVEKDTRSSSVSSQNEFRHMQWKMS